MGLIGSISQQRRNQIVSYVVPHLGDGEEVLRYARARDPSSKRKGFLYLTPKRLLLAWKQDGDPVSIPWSDIRVWRVDKDGTVPVLSAEGGERSVVVELRTATHAMTVGVRDFLKRFAELAPDGSRAPGSNAITADGHHEVNKERLTPARLTRRIAITALGLALIIVAGFIVVLPGPWSILLVIAGLAILAGEYDWAEDALDWAKTQYQAARRRLRERRNR